MAGVIASHGYDNCAAVVLNTSHLPITLTKASPLANLTPCSQASCSSVSSVLSVTKGKPVLKDISHLWEIDLQHVPPAYLPDCKVLLAEFADIFSKHYLDIDQIK